MIDLFFISLTQYCSSLIWSCLYVDCMLMELRTACICVWGYTMSQQMVMLLFTAVIICNFIYFDASFVCYVLVLSVTECSIKFTVTNWKGSGRMRSCHDWATRTFVWSVQVKLRRTWVNKPTEIRFWHLRTENPERYRGSCAPLHSTCGVPICQRDVGNKEEGRHPLLMKTAASCHSGSIEC